MKQILFVLPIGRPLVCATALLLLMSSLVSCKEASQREIDRSPYTTISVDGPCAAASPDSPLSRAACDAGVLVGTAVRSAALPDKPNYTNVITREFTYVTPENEMKWRWLQPMNGNNWDFSQADTIVAAAETGGLAVKGHTLIWHDAMPSHLSESTTAPRMNQAIASHIEQTMLHYRDKVVAFDVVNEAFNDDGTMRESLFYNVLGADYITKAFTEADKWTHKAGYDIDLIYNDFGILSINPKSDAVYALMTDLLAQGVPVDGVGIQAHIEAISPPSLDGILSNFQRFEELGLSVNISEMDVRVREASGSSADKLALQQQIYHKVAYACAISPNCTAVTVWGVNDNQSWVDQFFGADDPLLLNDNNQRKPAYRGMVDGFRKIDPGEGNLSANLASAGSFETDIHGFYARGKARIWRTPIATHSGKLSLRCGERTAAHQGPALRLTGKVQPNYTYAVSAFVQLLNSQEASATLNLDVSCRERDKRTIVLGRGQVSDRGFNEISGTFVVPDCTVTDLSLYINGPDAAVEILVDDMTVRQIAEPLGEELLKNPGFDNNTLGWFPFGSGPDVEISDDAHTGTGALLTTDRRESWQGPATNLDDRVTQGATYRLSAFVKLFNEGITEVKMSIKSVCHGVETYSGVASASVDNTGWVEMVGYYEVPLCDEFSELALYFEGGAPENSYLIDDVSMKQRLSVPVRKPILPGEELLTNTGFENGTVDWYTFGGNLLTTGTDVYSGEVSAWLTDRTEYWQGVAYNVTELVYPNLTYNFSVQVKTNVAETDVDFYLNTNCLEGDETERNYDELASVTAGTEWVTLSGSFTMPGVGECQLDRAQIYVSGPEAGIDIYYDDFSLVQAVTE